MSTVFKILVGLFIVVYIAQFVVSEEPSTDDSNDLVKKFLQQIADVKKEDFGKMLDEASGILRQNTDMIEKKLTELLTSLQKTQEKS